MRLEGLAAIKHWLKFTSPAKDIKGEHSLFFEYAIQVCTPLRHMVMHDVIPMKHLIVVQLASNIT